MDLRGTTVARDAGPSRNDAPLRADWGYKHRRYTRSGRLAGEGTSNGGITVGGAITQRPELFASALIRVGVSNPLRFEETENVLNVPEYGSVKTEASPLVRGLPPADEPR